MHACTGLRRRRERRMEYKFKIIYFTPTGHGGAKREEYVEIKKTDTAKGVYMAAMERAVDMLGEGENIDSIELMGIRTR
jgi:hypothetical protein